MIVRPTGDCLKMPLVSVIMTSYNYGLFISRAIDSVLSQTFTDFEIIVIDDGSRDNSREIIRDYCRRDPRVRYVFHRSNAGAAKSYNEGIQAAHGKFIAFLDSDDLWSPDKLQRQMDLLAGDEDLVVWTEGEIINKEGKPAGKRFTELFDATGKKKSGNIFHELVNKNFIFLSSVIFKKDNLKGIRFNEDIYHMNDFIFFLDLSRLYDFHFIGEPLVKYRIHGSNISLKDMDSWNKGAILSYQYIVAKYGADLDKKMSSRFLCLIGLMYIRADRYGDSLKYMGRGIKAYPPSAYHLLFLPTTLVKHSLRNTFLNRLSSYKRLAEGT